MNVKRSVSLLVACTVLGCHSGRMKTQPSNATNQTNQTVSTMNDNSITGKYWKMVRLEGREVTMAKNQEREIYFTLKTVDSLVTGFSGCNQFSGKYQLETGNRIRFLGLATTMKACPDVAVNESEVLEVFNLANNYTINGDTLQLNVGRRAPLAMFKAVYF